MYRQESYRASIASQSEQLLPILRALNWAKSRVGKMAAILDIGCGTGSLLNLIQNKISSDWDLWGMDISEIAITQGQALFSDLYLVQRDVSNSQYNSNDFDIIISYGSLEHFYNPEAAIKEIGRILKPGGYFFLMMSGVDKMKPENGDIKEIDVQPHTTGRTTSYLRRPDGLPMQTDVTNFAEFIDRGYGSVSDELIVMADIDTEFQEHNILITDKGGLSRQGWDAVGQPQWNLFGYTWRKYIMEAGLKLWNESTISKFKPRHIQPYFFGEK